MQLRIIRESDALPAEVDALKRLQAETAARGKLKCRKTEALKLETVKAECQRLNAENKIVCEKNIG